MTNLKVIVSRAAFPAVSFALFVVGFALIALFVSSEGSPHLGSYSVGLLTAMAAFLGGSFVGLIVGVPRYVSSGQYRFDGGPGTHPPADSGNTRIRAEPSTNLAEISDWLTKLLLGAGLVELSRLGHPLSGLIHTVARGISGTPPTGKVTDAAVVIAATILVAYGVLGFLNGYVTTNLWYGKHIGKTTGAESE